MMLLFAMTHSFLDTPSRHPPPRRRGRAVVAWLALAALLGNVLLPAGLSIALDLLGEGIGPVKSTLCSAAAASDLPGKAKPGLLVHHCALCNVPTAQLQRPRAGFVLPRETVAAVHRLLRTASPTAPFRQGPVQARAPPAVA